MCSCRTANTHFTSGRQVASDAAAAAAVYSQFADQKLIIINYLGLNLKMCHGAIVDIVVNTMCTQSSITIGCEMKKT